MKLNNLLFMNNNYILQILMSLLIEIAASHNHNILHIANSDEISHKLANAGLNKRELMFILMWLRNFNKLSKFKSFNYDNKVVRIFSSDEKDTIPDSCLYFLLESYNSEQISAMELEFIINQIMLLNSKKITESQFMWIYDMTLANRDESQDLFLYHKDYVTSVSFLYH